MCTENTLNIILNKVMALYRDIYQSDLLKRYLDYDGTSGKYME